MKFLDPVKPDNSLDPGLKHVTKTCRVVDSLVWALCVRAEHGSGLGQSPEHHVQCLSIENQREQPPDWACSRGLSTST